MNIKAFLQIETIIKALVKSFCFILIHMLLVYGHYKYVNSFSEGTVFISQNQSDVYSRHIYDNAESKWQIGPQ